MGNLGGWEIVIILGVLVLLFGAKRLPDMARSLGQSARVLKGEMKGLKNEDHLEAAPATPQRPTSNAVPPSARVESMSAEQLRAEADRLDQLHADRRRADQSGAAGQ